MKYTTFLQRQREREIKIERYIKTEIEKEIKI